MTFQTDKFGIIKLDKIQEQLSPIARAIFRLAFEKLIENPDNEKRNAKYADLLTEHFKKAPFFLNGDVWKNGQIVTFENQYIFNVEDLFDELTSLSLRTSKRGRHGFVSFAKIFIGAGGTLLPHKYGYLDRYLYYLEFNDRACEIISDNEIKQRIDMNGRKQYDRSENT